jgi:beta-glucanase (GH16 family)
MEYYRISGVPTLLANVAWGSDKSRQGEWDSVRKPLRDFLVQVPDWCDMYHVWSMDWDEEAIRLYLDGMLMNETTLAETVNPDGSNPFSPPSRLYLLLNLALGSNGGIPDDEGFPVTFEVDYVRVYLKGTVP